MNEVSSSISEDATAKRPREELLQEDDAANKRTKVETEDSTENSQSLNKGKKREKRDASGYPKSRQGKEKDDKNKGRRRGSRREELPREDDGAPKTPRLPKRQSGLLIGFCGTGCAGMQIQPNVRTIEGVLFEALVKAGAVSDDNADDPVKVNLGRAARTDAGVHAAGNLVSMKIITSVPGVMDIVARVNEELPPEIRLWGIVRTQNSFNARTLCDSRKYTYFFPTYLLIPPKPGSGLAQTIRAHSPDIPTDSFWGPGTAQATIEQDLARKRLWRVKPEQVEQLRAAAKQFEGTHNFHNFTVGREFKDRSNQRHMKSIEVSDPAMHGETEWISVLFHGQSFMLHQIRKMMSALVLSVRTGTPSQVIDEMYGPRVVFVPKMPSLGLLLEYPIFDAYNQRMVGINQSLQPTDAEYRPAIDFEAYRPQIDKFKEDHIYSRMRAIEDKDALFDGWMRSIDAYTGQDLSYLSSKGTIPASAVIKKGERRDNPFREKRQFDSTNFPVGGKSSAEDLQVNDGEDEDEEGLDKVKLADMEG